MMAGESTIMPTSLQQRAVHELAKICWGKFILRRGIFTEIDIPETVSMLINHRDKVLNDLPQTLNALPKQFSCNLPKRVIDKVFIAVNRLEQGYKEAIIWEQKYQFSLPATILNPITADKYQAGNFIDPTGHFNDLFWTKRFVNDKRKSVYYRFQMACFYGLEETIISTWQIMRTDNDLPYVGWLQLMPPCQEAYLVDLWANELENIYDAVVDENNGSYNYNFNFRGVVQAFFHGHEYAARFFWTRLPDNEKMIFLTILEFDCIVNAAVNHQAGLVHFYYSLLSQEQRRYLIVSDYDKHEGLGVIWSCMLNSPYYESVLDDALYFSVSSEIYKNVFPSLVFSIRESRLPTQAQIFKLLWNNLDEESQKEILEMDFRIIFALIEIRRIDLIETIVQPLQYYLKRKIVLYNWQGAGCSALIEFSKIGDYDALLRYLLCFLIYRDPHTQRVTLITNARQFFYCYLKGMVTHWTKFPFFQSMKKEVDNNMNILEGALDVLYGLVEQIDGMQFIEI